MLVIACLGSALTGLTEVPAPSRSQHPGYLNLGGLLGMLGQGHRNSPS